MPRPEKPDKPREPAASGPSSSDQEKYTHLVLDREADEDDAEGETTLTFISRRPPPGSND